MNSNKYKLIQTVCNKNRCVCNDVYNSNLPHCSKTVTYQIVEIISNKQNEILAEFLDYPKALKVFQGMPTR
jgi:hypothetical protein